MQYMPRCRHGHTKWYQLITRCLCSAEGSDSWQLLHGVCSSSQGTISSWAPAPTDKVPPQPSCSGCVADASPGLEFPSYTMVSPVPGTNTSNTPLKNLQKSTGHRQRHSAITGCPKESCEMAPLLSPLECPSLLHPAELWAGPAPPHSHFLPPEAAPAPPCTQTLGKLSLQWGCSDTARAKEPSQASGQSYSPEILQSLQTKLCIHLKQVIKRKRTWSWGKTTRTDKFQQVQNFNWSLTCLSLLLFLL